MRLSRRDIRWQPWLIASAAWLGPALLAVIKVYIELRMGDRKEATWRILLWEGGDWLLYALFTPFVFLLAKRYPLRRESLWTALPFHFLASIVFCAGWTTAGSFLHGWLFPNEKSEWSMLGWFVGSLPFGFAVYFAVVAAEHAFRYLLESRQRETQAALLAAQLAEARLGALRMQLNPHFLFNSLNTILVMVRDGDDNAAAASIERLAGVLRRVLKVDQEHEVTLADEIDFLQQYLAIEQTRFSDRLRPRFDIAPSLLSAAVPELILQPLVENALRHGIGKRTDSGELIISARRDGGNLALTVQDDGPGLPTTGVQDGVGLANTRERLSTLYSDRAHLELSSGDRVGTVALIRLPFREITSKPGNSGVSGND